MRAFWAAREIVSPTIRSSSEILTLSHSNWGGQERAKSTSVTCFLSDPHINFASKEIGVESGAGQGITVSPAHFKHEDFWRNLRFKSGQDERWSLVPLMPLLNSNRFHEIFFCWGEKFYFVLVSSRTTLHKLNERKKILKRQKIIFFAQTFFFWATSECVEYGVRENA